MSGGMGGGGVSETPAIPSDLEAIYQGGQFFLDRMKAMGMARDFSEAALRELQLGQDAKRAYDDARARLAAASLANAAAGRHSCRAGWASRKSDERERCN